MKVLASYIFILLSVSLNAQDTITLEKILLKVEGQSLVIKLAEKSLEISNAQQGLYKAKLRPTFGLDLLLPNFVNTTAQITQPDGSIVFQQITQNNSSISVYGNQNIALTGTNVFIQSDLQRFDNFSNDILQYNGVPIRIGFVQPFFAYNPLKWEKTLIPLQQKEAKFQLDIAKENAKWQVSNFYFDILWAKARKEIAQTNKEVNEKLLEITQERYDLGKTSFNEVLQLEMELKRAQLSEKQAIIQEEQAIAALYTFLGEASPINQLYQLPENIVKKTINQDLLLVKAKQNRPDIIRLQRELIERDQELAATKSQYGIQSNLFAVFGLARGSENLSDIYQNPFSEQQVRFNISLPIYDGGKRKEALKIAQLKKEISLENQSQLIKEIENEIKVAMLGFLQAQEDVDILLEIKKLADDRFTISNRRYTLGKISITELTLAQREKDQVYRDYIIALRAYWSRYYELRTLTGENI